MELNTKIEMLCKELQLPMLHKHHHSLSNQAGTKNKSCVPKFAIIRIRNKWKHT